LWYRRRGWSIGRGGYREGGCWVKDGVQKGRVGYGDRVGIGRG